MPVVIDDAWYDSIKKTLPELPEVKAERYVSELGLAETDAGVLTSSRTLCDLFEAAYPVCGSAKDAAGFIIGDLMSLAGKKQVTADDISLDGNKLAQLIKMVTDKEITRNAARRVLAALWEKDVDPRAFVAENNLAAQSDEGAIKDIVSKVVSSNEKIVADYKAGKTKAIQALFGLVMKELRGNGDPAVIRSLLEDALK